LGKLVPFERREPNRDSGKSARPTTEAEILMFTGIRYERQSPAAPTKPSTSPRTKRKGG
jgi:hypothetical protein